MAYGYGQDEPENPYEQDEDDALPFGADPAQEGPFGPPGAEPVGPVDPQSGTIDKPRDIPGLADQMPTRPLDSGNTAAPTSFSGPNGAQDSGANYTPVRPRKPMSTPGAFSSMPGLPGASPSAMSVAMRAPYMASPAQAGIGGGPRLLSRAGGLIQGGQGVVGADQSAAPDELSSLIQMLLQQR